MNCEWYQAQLANDNAELWRNGRPSATLLDHSRQCTVCDRMIERELQLKLLFTDFSEKSRSAEPSAAVKRNLLAELETMRPQQRAQLGWIPRFAIAAAAIACLVLVLVLVLARRAPVSGSQHNVAKAPAVQPSAAPPSVAEPQTANAQQVATVNKAVPVRVKTARNSSRNAQRVAETANDFYPMVMCDSITCAGPAVTVRVELPPSQLSARRNSGSKVMADLLVGEDGLVRGVRLLQ